MDGYTDRMNRLMDGRMDGWRRCMHRKKKDRKIERDSIRPRCMAHLEHQSQTGAVFTLLKS